MKEERLRVLLLDDEERIVRSVKALLRTEYKVKATTDPYEALEYLNKHEVMAIISDQRMPEMTGVEVLKRAKKVSPGTMRLLLTGYADKEAVIDSVNHGEIYRYINKPWDGDTLKAVVAEAVDVAQRTFHVAKMSDDDLSSIDKPLVLIMDESGEVSQVVQQSFHDELCEFEFTDSLEAGYQVLAEKHVDILVTDTKFSGGNMMNSIKLLKANYPELVTIVTTNYKDSNALIALINEGQVFRFLLKPISKIMLHRSLVSAVKRVKQNRLNPELLERNKVMVSDAVVQASEKKKTSSLMALIRARRNKNKSARA